MSTLYVDRKHAALRCEDRRLVLRINGTAVQSLPLAMVERVVITQPVETDTRSLASLAAAGIGVSILHGRKQSQLAVITGLPGADARRRLAQYAAWHDLATRRGLVHDLLRLKLPAQYRFVSQLLRARPDARRTLSAAARTLRNLSERLRDDAPGLQALRGIEGAASAAGFRALQAVLPPELGFRGRRRRPPPDPANALLSLGYTLTYSMALEAAHAAGFDPAIGYLHDPLWGRHSLAADLMEPLRPRIEAFVWNLFRQRRLTADHFSRRGDSCLLGKSGRALFYGEWESQADAYRRWLRRLTRNLVHRLEVTDDT